MEIIIIVILIFLGLGKLGVLSAFVFDFSKWSLRRKLLLVPFLIFRPFRFFVFFRNYNGQKQPGHWAEVVCHFHLLAYL